jgi:hypothetical protein
MLSASQQMQQIQASKGFNDRQGEEQASRTCMRVMHVGHLAPIDLLRQLLGSTCSHTNWPISAHAQYIMAVCIMPTL